MPDIKSDKERHHLSQHTAQNLNDELYQLIHGDDNGHRNEDEKEGENSRGQQEQRRRQPLEGSENKVYHLTTHFQNDTHKAEQQDRAEHEINQHFHSERERTEEVTTKGEELADIRKDKEQICNQSHTLPSNPAPSSK